MAVTVTQYPTYPVPGSPVRITFSTEADYVRVYITNAPRKSEYYQQIQDADSSQVKLYQGDARRPWQFVPDAAGKFILMAYDITKGATSYGGGWYGSPDGERTETISDTSTGIEIIAGSKMELPLGTTEHSATLRFYVWGDYVRETTIAAHGEATPAVVDPSSERAENAARACDPSTIIDYLATYILSNAGGADMVDEFIDEFNDHCGNVGGDWHVAADTDNPVSDDYKGADGPERRSESVAEILNKFDRHLRNDDGTGTGAAGYHGAPDWENATIVGAPADMGTAFVAIADLWRAYEAHRVDTGAHTGAGGADTTNTLAGLNMVGVIVRSFFAEIAKLDPTAAATANPGAEFLSASAGMSQS